MEKDLRLINIETGEIFDSGYTVKKTVEDEFHHNFKGSENFIKFLNSSIVKMIKELSLSELKVIFELALFVSYDDNILRDENGKRLNVQDLCKLLDMKYDSLIKIIKSLEDKNYILRTKISTSDNPKVKLKSIIVNPDIYFKGNRMKREITKLFYKQHMDNVKNKKAETA